MNSRSRRSAIFFGGSPSLGWAYARTHLSHREILRGSFEIVPVLNWLCWNVLCMRRDETRRDEISLEAVDVAIL
jgi:hypothetical protein